MSRKEYNQCMRPFLIGSKTKEQRKLDFCIGAKVCSKGVSRDEAEGLCSIPKEQKGAKKIGHPIKTKNLTVGCPIKIEPMSKWITRESDEVCRPCLLPPVLQWYRSELEESGQIEKARGLASTIENNPDPLQLCQELDIIKSEVGEALRERLKEFDCSIQTYEPSAT